MRSPGGLPTVRAERAGRLMTITLDRPGQANALDLSMACQLRDAVRLIDDGVGCVLLRAEGANFCVGGDIRAFAAAPEPGKFLGELASVRRAAARAGDHQRRHAGAFVVPSDASDPPDPAVLRRYARERLAGFKVPAYWYSVGSLPHSAAGKLLRRELASWQANGVAGPWSPAASPPAASPPAGGAPLKPQPGAGGEYHK